MLPMLPMLPTPPSQAPGATPRAAGGGRARSLRWRGRLLAVAKAPAAPSRPALPAPPLSDAARATVALDCYCAAGGVTVYSHGRRDRRTRTAGSTGSPHSPAPRGPRGGGGGAAGVPSGAARLPGQ